MTLCGDAQVVISAYHPDDTDPLKSGPATAPTLICFDARGGENTLPLWSMQQEGVLSNENAGICSLLIMFNSQSIDAWA